MTPKPKPAKSRDKDPTSIYSPYAPRANTPLSVILAYFYERNRMQYREVLEGRRSALDEKGLSIYREACRQENVKSGGTFGPLTKVDLDDLDSLVLHDRLIGIAEALTSKQFESILISKEEFDAAMIEYEGRKNDGD